MIEAILGGLLIAALLGWAATNALYARALLPMSNAFKVLHEVDWKIDQRINAILERAKANTKRPEIPSGKPEQPKPAQYNPAIFSATVPPLIPSFLSEEQPDSDLEGTDA